MDTKVGGSAGRVASAFGVSTVGTNRQLDLARTALIVAGCLGLLILLSAVLLTDLTALRWAEVDTVVIVGEVLQLGASALLLWLGLRRVPSLTWTLAATLAVAFNTVLLIAFGGSLALFGMLLVGQLAAAAPAIGWLVRVPLAERRTVAALPRRLR